MRSRDGFTLIEVLVAMTLLGIAVLGLQAVVTDRLLHDVGREEARANARQLVDDRLSEVHTEPQYAALGGRFAGTETDLPDFPGFVRRTVVTPRTEHTVITVEVVIPMWFDTIAGTTVVGIP